MGEDPPAATEQVVLPRGGEDPKVEAFIAAPFFSEKPAKLTFAPRSACAP